LDSDLWLRIRVYQPTQPLNDFAEIVARIQALVFCLDVTDEVVSDDDVGNRDALSKDDIELGGACRIRPIS